MLINPLWFLTDLAYICFLNVSLIFSLKNVFEQNNIYIFPENVFDKIIFDIFTARDAKFITHLHRHIDAFMQVCVYMCACIACV